MKLKIASYNMQMDNWPSSGRHILAQYDEETIIVYQAYNRAIGEFAVRNGYMGGDFQYTRMSWIKPNFLWMMYRSGWGTKLNQEVTLAIRLHRDFFERILDLAVPSSFASERYENYEDWQEDIKKSNVRLQWDPDHSPSGSPLVRRAIQLGLRNSELKEFGREQIVDIIDLSEFVEEQRKCVELKDYQELKCPVEEIYIPRNLETKAKLGLKD